MMKTRLRNLGMALVLAVAVIGVNAADMKNIADIAPETKMEVENWMTDYTLFDVNKSVTNAGTVVDIAVSNPDFSILVEAVTKAELAGALSADGPFTVFAPTNDAFNSLFKELGVDGIEDLSKEESAKVLGGAMVQTFSRYGTVTEPQEGFYGPDTDETNDDDGKHWIDGAAGGVVFGELEW